MPEKVCCKAEPRSIRLPSRTSSETLMPPTGRSVSVRRGTGTGEGCPWIICNGRLKKLFSVYDIPCASIATVPLFDRGKNLNALKRELFERLAYFVHNPNCFLLAHFNQGVFIKGLHLPHISPVGDVDIDRRMVCILDVDPDVEEPYWISFDTFWKGVAWRYNGVIQRHGYQGGRLHMDQDETAGLPGIINRIIALPDRDSIVTDVRIGLGYTAVELDRNRLGLAYTFTESFAGGCELFDRNRFPIGQPAADLVRLAASRHPIEAAVGFAAANAMVNSMHREYLDGDVLSLLALRKEDRVCMVGNFMPIVPRLRSLVSELHIFERIAEPVDDLIPSDRIGGYLPDSQVLLITATALINHTAEKNCR